MRHVVCLGLFWTCVIHLATAQDIETLDPNFAVREPGASVVWYDALALGMEGQGWADVAAPYDRLPAKAEGVVRDAVWSLSRHSAGLSVRFVSDSPEISARWSLTSGNLGMPHMPATGVSGLDLYARDGGRWRWVAGARPAQQNDNEAKLVGAAPPGVHEYWLFLPLYNGTSKLEIGVAPDARIGKAPKRDDAHAKPIVFYGTSITQGGCASRPGMAYPALLARQFDRPTINLGFSGNGKMEPEMADLLSELNPVVYVLDCLPNMNADLVRERVAPFVHTLRKTHPDTPIVLVENIVYQDSWFSTATPRHEPKNEALRDVFAQLKKEKVKGLSYVSGETLLGDDGLGTVDGTHPTDLGFFRQADALKPAIRKALREIGD